MDKEDKLSIFNILKNVEFFENIPKNYLKSTGMKDALYNLPKIIAKIRSPPLPAIEKTEYIADDLKGELVKTIIPSNINDMYTRFKILLGLKLSGRTVTFTEASNLIDELYKRGEIQNERQYRNALDKFQT